MVHCGRKVLECLEVASWASMGFWVDWVGQLCAVDAEAAGISLGNSAGPWLVMTLQGPWGAAKQGLASLNGVPFQTAAVLSGILQSALHALSAAFVSAKFISYLILI